MAGLVKIDIITLKRVIKNENSNYSFNQINMILIDAAIQTPLRITGFVKGYDLEARLRQLGLVPGDSLRILRQAPLGGPLLVEINGRSIALGRGVAARVEVEEIACVSD